MSRPWLSPAAVDWAILVAVLVETTTGLVSLVTGRPSGAWVFVLHGVVGVTLAALVALKLWRVRSRLKPARLTRQRAFSLVLAALAFAALGTGVAWPLGVTFPLDFWTLMNVHILFGLLLVPVLAVHLRYRWRAPGAVTRQDETRRTAIRATALLVGGALVWRLQQAASAAANLPGQRFTGSRADGSGQGNRFPVTSWVADDPDPIDVDDWTLTVRGHVTDPLALTLDDIASRSTESQTWSTERATLDCTSGWYSVHDWRGVRVGDLLDAAGTREGARWVQFQSVTGYRWSLPIEEARDALLATHVEDAQLSHGHGFPMRLVAPGRRGFQWVKWVEAVDVSRSRDPGEWVAIFVSGFDEA